jgi:hypothetical protein
MRHLEKFLASIHVVPLTASGYTKSVYCFYTCRYPVATLIRCHTFSPAWQSSELLPRLGKPLYRVAVSLLTIVYAPHAKPQAVAAASFRNGS